MAYPAQLPLICRSASSVKVRDGGKQDVKPRYRKESADRGTSMVLALLVRYRYLAVSNDFKTILTLKKQDALAKLANPTASATLANVVMPAVRSASSHAMSSDEVDRTMSGWVEGREGGE